MAPAALGGHDGMVAGADAHTDTEFERRDIQSAERLDEPEAGLLVIGEDVAGHRAAIGRGEPDRLGFGDQIADGQDKTVARGSERALPARSVPSVPAVKASSGIVARKPSTAPSARSRSKLHSPGFG